MNAFSATRNLPPAAVQLIAWCRRNAATLRAAACILLAAVVGKLAAQLIWVLVPLPASAGWQPLPPPPRNVSANAGPDLSVIASANLFDRYQPPSVSSTAALVGAPDTQLNLTLLGIFASDRSNSFALIATQDGDEKPYGLGENITPGTVLQAIFPDRVVLARGARLETLRLDKDKASAPGTAVALNPEDEAEPDTDGPPPLMDVRNKLLADPSKASDYIRLSPVNVNGAQHGYRVFPGKDRALFGMTGLRPGDVVTSVNGVELNDPARGLQLLGSLAQASDLTVVVDRAGQSQTIRVSLGSQ